MAVFYLAEVPEDFDTIRDFRCLPQGHNSALTPALAFIIRQVQNRQEWMHETLRQQAKESLPFMGSASIRTPAHQIAASIRAALGITERQQMACRTRREALNLWTERCEEAGIFVCRQGTVGRERIQCEEVRGFALSDAFAPFVFINSNDALVAMIFTLVHELAHLWINQSGVSNLVSSGRPVDEKSAPIEAFCNKVAALALLPMGLFDQLWRETDATRNISSRIEAISESLKISEEVIARRLLEKKVINQIKYSELRVFYEARWQRLKDEEKQKYRKKDAGPSPHLLNVLKNGRAFTSTVLYFYSVGQISGSSASHILNAKIDFFPNLATFAANAKGRINVDKAM